MSHAFGTQNIRHSENRENIQSVLRLIKAKSLAELDVLAAQELTGTRNEWVLDALPGWRMWFKRAPTNGTGLLWKHETWDLLKKGLRTIYKPGRDGPVEVYKGVRKPEWRRYASWVTLRDRKTGEVASFVCVHGKLGGEGKGKQWQNLKRLVRHLQKQGPVFVAGDLNALELPVWMEDATVWQDRIDRVMVFGPAKVGRKLVLSKQMLRNLVDHPGGAVGWSHKS